MPMPGGDPMGFEQIFNQNPFFQNPEQFMRNAQNNGAHIHTSFSNNTSNNFNVYNTHSGPGNNFQYQQNYSGEYPGYSQPSPRDYPQRGGFAQQRPDTRPKSEDSDMKRNTLKLNQQGNQYYRRKQYRKALECYELGLDIQKHWKLYKNMAWCYKQLGLFKESVKYIKKAIGLRPKDNVLFRLGGIFSFSLFTNSEKLGDGKQMQSFFRHAFELDSSDLNQFNWMLARKVVYLFIQKEEKREKEELMNYLLDKPDSHSQVFVEDAPSSEDEEHLSQFLKSNFYEQRPQVPEHLKGKISLEIMKHPILTLSGVSYERDYILRSFEENGWKDPTTNQQFHTENCLIYNQQLKKHIKDFLQKNKWGFMSDEHVKDWKLFEFK